MKTEEKNFWWIFFDWGAVLAISFKLLTSVIKSLTEQEMVSGARRSALSASPCLRHHLVWVVGVSSGSQCTLYIVLYPLVCSCLWLKSSRNICKISFQTTQMCLEVYNNIIVSPCVSVSCIFFAAASYPDPKGAVAGGAALAQPPWPGPGPARSQQRRPSQPEKQVGINSLCSHCFKNPFQNLGKCTISI